MPITGRLAAISQHLETLFSGDLEPHGLEAVVHAAAGDVLDCGNRIIVAGVHHMGCPHGLCELELGLDHVHGDDLVGASDASALDGGQTDAARTDDSNGFTRSDLCCTEHRTKTGCHTTADKCPLVERHVLVDLHECLLVDKHLLGKRREVKELIDGLATTAEP